MIVKWKPTNVSRMMDDFFDDEFKFSGQDMTASMPAVNVKESEEDYRVELATPGLEKNDFKINVEGNVLTISAQKEETKEEKENGRFNRREFSYRSFVRSFSLPENVDREKIAANYKDGILNLTIPKREKEEKKSTKQINVS
ncbi:MAG: Hsp20/alpha crystallin family protein [Cytophagaceae bacterium]